MNAWYTDPPSRPANNARFRATCPGRYVQGCSSVVTSRTSIGGGKGGGSGGLRFTSCITLATSYQGRWLRRIRSGRARAMVILRYSEGSRQNRKGPHVHR